MFSNDNKTSAKLSDNHLVLSLPDAMTPVVWMIDMNKSGSFFMRVDKDDNGLHILQKIEGSGKSVNIEDIAYYSDKKNAVNAMTIVGKVLDNPSSKTYKPSKSGGFLKSFFSFLLALVFIVILILGGLIIYGSSLNDNANTPQMAQNQPAPPQVESNPNAVGVPLSADDYLNQKSNYGLPF